MSRLPAAWRSSTLIFLVACAPRLLHLLSLQSLPTFDGYIMDEAYHDAWARRIAAGDWVGHEVFFRAPLYPYLLALVYALGGTGGMEPRLLQVLMGSASVVLVHRIARRFCAPGPAVAAALLCALAWPLIHYDTELLLPVLEVFLSLASIFLLLRGDEGSHARAWTVAGGVALGLACITRPNFLAFAPAAVLWRAWPRPGGRPWISGAGWLLLGLVLPILPVTARNALVAHDAVLISSQGGVNFFIGNNPEADGTTAVVPGTRPTWAGGYEDTVAIARRAAGRGDLPDSAVSRYWFRRGIAFWRDQPWAAVRLTLRKTILFFSGVEISNNKDLSFFRSLSPVLSLPLPATWLLAPLGIAGWLLAWPGAGSRRLALALPLGFGIAYAASVILFFVTTRYRLPVLPWMALGAGLLVDRLIRWAREGRARHAVAGAAAAIALLIVLNLSDRGGHGDDPAQGHMALAQGWEALGRESEAADEYRRAAAAGGPYRYEALAREGEALARLGRSREALDSLQRSLRERPDNLDAAVALLGVAATSGGYGAAREFAIETVEGDRSVRAALQFAVGSMDQRLGRQEDAEAAYRRTLELDPRHLGAALNLALLLRAQGRLPESLDRLLEAERIDPADAAVQIQLAKHYLAVGDRARALTHARRAQDAGAWLEPEFREAMEAR